MGVNIRRCGQKMSKVFSAKSIHSPQLLNTIKQRYFITKLFYYINSIYHLCIIYITNIFMIHNRYNMNTTQTPEKVIEEIKNMVEPTAESFSIKEGDIVEIISEHFKKEKAKVTRIDKQKEEVVVSLLGAVVPLPVTLKIDNVRVIRREEDPEIDGVEDAN